MAIGAVQRHPTTIEGTSRPAPAHGMHIAILDMLENTDVHVCAHPPAAERICVTERHANTSHRDGSITWSYR